ncbi:glucose-6-phosphate dehydrogenase [Candidatus Saccharibacteria bacterium]|nr:MAG: glucose-6-phosphate dehydrogenase [Candidatus Saccharibacteria bacterium]PID99353.1 MAG: glucose-6-phosphate dehydrogenase [Candidatus Saccharibacteria bacterium]
MSDYLDKPLVLVIFGITGDLSQRKLLPALYHLIKHQQLPEIKIVGISRKEIPVSEVYKNLHQKIYGSDYDQAVVEQLYRATEMVQVDLDNSADYEKLLQRLRIVSDELGPGVSRLYYLSIPSQAFVTVVHHLGETNHHEPFEQDSERPRLLVEKPFGFDTASAKTLVQAADEHFGEQQTFRIDHYLAKETAQNILTFRFQNPLFQTIWNTKHIESIRIVAYETIGIENRAGFYEQTGALRDLLQSHLMQLLALITMEKPAALESHDIHRTKLRLLESIDAIAEDEVETRAIRGQYDSYKTEVANAESHVETFARLHLNINNEQWRGVRVTIETGKALHEKCTEITVRFRANEDAPGTNTLAFRVQPQEGITLSLQAKRPGLSKNTETVKMDFDYEREFYGLAGEAYERVIIDAIRGDQALFATAEEVLTSWRIVENVLRAWAKNGDGLHIYPVGAPAADIS